MVQVRVFRRLARVSTRPPRTSELPKSPVRPASLTLPAMGSEQGLVMMPEVAAEETHNTTGLCYSESPLRRGERLGLYPLAGLPQPLGLPRQKHTSWLWM